MRYHQKGLFLTALLLTIQLNAPCIAAHAQELEAGLATLSQPVVASAESEPPLFGIAREEEGTTQSVIASDKAGTTQSVIATQKQDSAKRRLKIGLALGGGGTRGAAHIGVIRILQSEGIPIDCVAGTSIGAIVGGLYCSGVPLDDIEKMVAKKSLKNAFFTVPIWLRAALVPVFLLPHAIGHRHYDGLYRGNRFATFLNKSVGSECQSVEDLKIPFCAVAASLKDGKAHALSKGNFGRLIQASSAIPMLRRPVEIDNDLYVDGGIINNLPVDEARKLGADIVIAVDVDQSGGCDDLREFKKIGSVANRVINMVLCRVDDDQLDHAEIVIHPNVNNIKLLSTKEKDAYYAIEAGETAAKAKIAAIRQLIKDRELAASDTADNQKTY